MLITALTNVNEAAAAIRPADLDNVNIDGAQEDNLFLLLSKGGATLWVGQNDWHTTGPNDYVRRTHKGVYDI